MKKALMAVLVMLLYVQFLSAQNNTGYNSILWQISGNGLQKPSYLFGTMHVSQKMVFHLGEPWFNAIQAVDVVAMEMNPDSMLDGLISSDVINSAIRMTATSRFADSKETVKQRYTLGK